MARRGFGWEVARGKGWKRIVRMYVYVPAHKELNGRLAIKVKGEGDFRFRAKR